MNVACVKSSSDFSASAKAREKMSNVRPISFHSLRSLHPVKTLTGSVRAKDIETLNCAVEQMCHKLQSVVDHDAAYLVVGRQGHQKMEYNMVQ